MSVGAIGGMAMGGLGIGGIGLGGALGGGPLNFGGLNGAVGTTSPLAFSSIKMQQLGELLQGFTSAEILMALMLLSAASRKKDEEDDGSSALALLAGMALARQLGQQNFACGLGGVSLDLGAGAVIGGCGLNLTA
jgi:hypothetical protein